MPVAADIKPTKIFFASFSELADRFDPTMILFNRKVKSFKYPTFPLKSLLLTPPQYGANESGTERTDKSQPRYIRITDIDEYGLLNDSIGVTADVIEEKYFLQNNDMLFARSGATVGKAYLHKTASVDYDCFFAGYMIRFVVDEKKILADYLFTFTQLNTYKEWVKAIQRAAGQPNINAEEYKSLKIPLPDLKTQKEIVKKINAAYEAKLKKELEAKQFLKKIDTYILSELGITLPIRADDLKSRIFLSNFSEIKDGRIDSYFYQEHFKKFFASLRKSKYPVHKIKDIAQKITSGITPLSGGDAYTTTADGVPFIRSGNINIDGQINYDDLLLLKPDIHKKIMRSSQLKVNDLLIAIVGATIGQVGIYLDNREANINQAIALVRLNKDVNCNYVKELIKSSIGQMNLDRLKRPVARANINLEEISTIQIVLPPIEKQNEMSENILQIRNQANKMYLDAKAILEKAKKEVEEMILG